MMQILFQQYSWQ